MNSFYDVCVSVNNALFSFTCDVVHFQLGSKATSVEIYAKVDFTGKKGIAIMHVSVAVMVQMDLLHKCGKFNFFNSQNIRPVDKET